MAAAIPAGIGLGTSLISGIQGKGAAKQQRQLAEKQLAQLQPLIQAQLAASQFGMDTAKGLLPQATNAIETIFNKSTGLFEPLVGESQSLMGDARGRSTDLFNAGRGLSQAGSGILGGSLSKLSGAAEALRDLQKFYRPFMFDGQRAIDRFLPSAQRTREMLAPEFGNINAGAGAASRKIAEFAPRGGGRISAGNDIEIARQKGLSDTFFQGRQALGDRALGAAFQGAGGQQGVAQALQALGLGQGQLGLGTIGQGLNTINSGTSLLGTQGGLAQNSLGQALQALGLGGSAAGNLGELASSFFGQGMAGGQGTLGNLTSSYNRQADRAYGITPQGTSGKGLGGFLVDLFNDKGMQKGVGDMFSKIFGKGQTKFPGYDF